MSKRQTLFLVSLGCPKNRVDSEVLLGVATANGFAPVDDPSLAHVIVVNTCGFIESAKRESIDCILEMAAFKNTGVCKRLIVTGCLSQLHPSELADGMPEVDHFLGSGDLPKLAEVLKGKAPRQAVGTSPGYLVHSTDRRVLSTGTASAYVKIAEGCDRKCAFCIIPQLRGPYRSRPVDDIVREVEMLASQGVYEINLVSQDSSAYGRDLLEVGKPTIAHLVERVASVPGVRWARIMYLYPDQLDAHLVDLLSGHPNVLPYVDMPMQHAADSMLRKMRRGYSQSRLRRIVEQLRKRVPDLTLRTAFIVGFPGENDQDFDELLGFIQWARFDRLGVFRYSDEEAAPSYALTNKTAARVSYARARRIMAAQRPIARASNRALVDRQIQVLVEGPSEEHDLVMTGRHAGQAPEIDGRVYFTNSEVSVGELWTARVVSCTDYDLVAEVVGDRPLQEPPPARKRRSLPVVGSQ